VKSSCGQSDLFSYLDLQDFYIILSLKRGIKVLTFNYSSV
jgi:hypothetical protein